MIVVKAFSKKDVR